MGIAFNSRVMQNVDIVDMNGNKSVILSHYIISDIFNCPYLTEKDCPKFSFLNEYFNMLYLSLFSITKKTPSFITKIKVRFPGL